MNFLKYLNNCYNIKNSSYMQEMYKVGPYNSDLPILSFEIFAVLSCLIILIFFAWLSNKNFKLENKEKYSYTTNQVVNVIIGCVILLMVILNATSVSFGYTALNGYYYNDPSIILYKNISLFIFLVFAPMLKSAAKDSKIDFEFVLLIYISFVCGLLLMNSNDILFLFFLLEAQTLCFYVVVTSKQTSSFSTEAGIKYFILGSFTSGIMLFGISLIYGASGIFNYHDLSFFASGISNSSNGIFDSKIFAVFILGILLFVFGLMFKLGAAPFHSWMPDVYEGSPLFVTTYLSTVAKIPIIFITFKLTTQIFEPVFSEIFPIMLSCAMASLVAGTFGAIYQLKMKRLLTYSMITNTGYILLCICFGGSYAFLITTFYTITYLVPLLGVFFCLFSLKVHQKKMEIKRITAFANLSEYNPALAFCLFILFFSLAGIPPLMGFYSKFMLFYYSLSVSLYVVCFILVIISAISVFYYIRVGKLMYFNRSKGWVFFKQIPTLDAFIISVTTLSTLLFFVFPDTIFRLIEFITLLLFS